MNMIRVIAFLSGGVFTLLMGILNIMVVLIILEGNAPGIALIAISLSVVIMLIGPLIMAIAIR